MSDRIERARAEIARRYTIARRRRRVDLLGLRIREMQLLATARHGEHVPDSDAGRILLRALAHHLIERPGDQARRLRSLASTRAPWADPAALVADWTASPQRYSARDLGHLLGLTHAERSALRITTIAAVDPPDPDTRRAAARERARQRRRAAGVQPRADWLASSLTHRQPWRALGISRASWYRAGRPDPA